MNSKIYMAIDGYMPHIDSTRFGSEHDRMVARVKLGGMMLAKLRGTAASQGARIERLEAELRRMHEILRHSAVSAPSSGSADSSSSPGGCGGDGSLDG